MKINRADDRILFHNRVLTTGRSGQAGKGNLYVAKFHTANKEGLEIISDFKNLPKDHKIAIQVATGNDEQNASTVPFSLSEVVGLKVNVPDTRQKVDEFVIGYNGLDEDSAIDVVEGEYQNHEIVLSDGLTNVYSANQETSFPFRIFRNKGETNQQAVERAVEYLQKLTFGDGNKLSDLVDISTVNSENEELTPDNSTPYNRWTLDLSSYTDTEVNIATGYNGGLLGFVKGAYNFKVVEDAPGQYSAVLPATVEEVDPLTIRTGSAEKNCECPNGYTSTETGYLYAIKTSDDKDTVTEALEDVSPKDLQEFNKDGDKKLYMFLVDETFDITEIDLVGAEIEELGHKDLYCTKEGSLEFSWVKGETCFAKTDTYTINIEHDECGNTHEDILKKIYGDGVTLVKTAGCQSKYSLDVITNIVCNECDPIYIDTFRSEAPEDFEGHRWKKVAKEYSKDALMGIRIKGKLFNSDLPDALFGKSKFFNESTRIFVNVDVCDEYTFNQEDLCASNTALTVLSTKTYLKNKGYDLVYLENEARRYFNDEKAKQSNMEQYFRNTESLVDLNAQYIIYNLQVRRVVNQGNSVAPKVESFNYLIPEKIGFQENIENLLNSLATASGIAPVKAL